MKVEIDTNGLEEEQKPEPVKLEQPALQPEQPAVQPVDPYINQRDPRVPSDLSLREKFVCWTGRNPATTWLTSIFMPAAMAGFVTYNVSETGFYTLVAAVAAVVAGVIFAGVATEAGTGGKNHTLTHRAARFDRLANQAMCQGDLHAEAQLRHKALFERRSRDSGFSHSKSRNIIGPDHLPLTPSRG